MTRTEREEQFEALVREVRPSLHRYCARMMGSVDRGEDVLQETLERAWRELERLRSMDAMKAWLYRTAQRRCIDLLRRQTRFPEEPAEELLSPAPMPLEERELAAMALGVFLHLPPRQRSAVILKDILGESLAYTAEFLETSVPGAKSLLRRGRATLLRARRDAEAEAIDLGAFDPGELARLRGYIDRFNARDFEAIRALLASNVRLELIGVTTAQGYDEVSTYFWRYEALQGWELSLGVVDGALGVLASFDGAADPAYFIRVGWRGEQIDRIRDYRYARYAAVGMQVL